MIETLPIGPPNHFVTSDIYGQSLWRNMLFEWPYTVHQGAKKRLWANGIGELRFASQRKWDLTKRHIDSLANAQISISHPNAPKKPSSSGFGFRGWGTIIPLMHCADYRSVPTPRRV
jgi:hypothetical protein